MLPQPLKQPIHNTYWCEKTTYIIFQLLICIHNSDPPYVRSYLHQVILFYNLSFRNVPSIIFNIDNIIEFQLCLQFSLFSLKRLLRRVYFSLISFWTIIQLQIDLFFFVSQRSCPHRLLCSVVRMFRYSICLYIPKY